MPARISPLLDRAAAEPFAAMTYPHHAPDLLSVEPDGPVVALAATLDGAPCGLALAQVDGTGASLLSVLVGRDRRKAGIGTQLVTAIEEPLRARGAKWVAGNFPLGKESTPAVERLLAKCGWSAPQPRMGLFSVGPAVPGVLRTAGWARESPLPPGFAVVPWLSLSEAQRAAATALVHSEGRPDFADPAAYPGDVHGEYSFALLKADRVVGWVIFHRASPAVSRLAILYADAPSAPPGMGLQLLGYGCRAWIADVDAGRGVGVTWVVEADNPFIRVCEGRLLRGVPHTLTRTARSEKQLV